MLELIKILVEAVAKSFSPKAILDARKQKRLTEIGTELFLVYTIVNEILVVGRRIVSELDHGLVWMRRKLTEGKPDEHLLTHIDFLLRQQSVNVTRLAKSIHRLRYEMQLISPDAYTRLIPLIEGKGNAISDLVALLSSERPRLVSVDQAELEALSQQAEAGLVAAPGSFLSDHYNDDRRVALIREEKEIGDVSRIPAAKHDVITAYLAARKPGLVLDEIESITRELRKCIAENFSLPDILLSVGDSRLGLSDPYV